jgi:1-acyl-sn-glycerol-3-phosphate acyltransferase
MKAPPALVGIVAALFAVANTLFWATPFYVLALVRLLMPSRDLRAACDRGLTRLAERWIESNNAALATLHSTRWHITGLEGLDPNVSYLVNANHQSWTDIVVLQRVFSRKIPFLRFFLKKELIWVPVLGLTWWALHFPFMKRYSPATLEKHPELRGKDLETTRKVCARLQGTPVSIINFLEGTRFTPVKHAAQSSPYRHLLRPKAGGFAFVLGAIGNQLHSLLDVTIVYPAGRPSFWGFLCGEVPDIVVHVDEREIPRALIVGDYAGDEAFRTRFKQWVDGLWETKDALIEALARDDATRVAVRDETPRSLGDRTGTAAG